MTWGGSAPKAAPIGWVFLDRHSHDGYAIRWRWGDAVGLMQCTIWPQSDMARKDRQEWRRLLWTPVASSAIHSKQRQ